MKSHRKRPSEAGFTLIETLVALTILAISLGAIGELAGGSLRSGAALGRHVAEVETARKIVAGLPGRNELASGALTGALENYQWRVDAKPYVPAFAAASGPWAAQAIALRVLSPEGSIVEVDTIRLRKRPQK
ncbi:prepilin-type N-terminal cleavage/methylation domain-containing protein [Methylocapsa sp. S129]|uniref:prepilin-type N-terminal cleavage/methylation domain-containing protein n=1 Tax=Methylocapsa sp. S129 TaxID=1641869 RepID=UPI00131D0C9A|nr:prepilin-type N-terminal cleavage/methylation domain-containing protein [Methylocapsa sp. S129]